MRRRREDLERYYEPVCNAASAGRIATKSLLTHEPGAMIYEHSFRPLPLPFPRQSARAHSHFTGGIIRVNRSPCFAGRRSHARVRARKGKSGDPN